MDVQRLIEEVLTKHYPRPPATAAAIAAFEARMGWSLDAEMRAFHLRCDGARLFRPGEGEFRFVPLDGIRPAPLPSHDSYGEYGPKKLYIVCEHRDGAFTAVDVSGPADAPRPLYTSSYEAVDAADEACEEGEAPEELLPSAASFGAFLYYALASGDRG